MEVFVAQAKIAFRIDDLEYLKPGAGVAL